jgi:hypothetical protein
VFAKTGRSEEGWPDLVARQVQGLRFGVVQIVVHDSRVVQIERTEKVRLDLSGGGPDRPLESTPAPPSQAPDEPDPECNRKISAKP